MSRISNLHRRAFGLFGLLFLVILASPAFADHDRAGVTLFRHVYFEGRQETFYGDVPDLRGTYIGNDAVSSIAVDRGCRVTLFADSYFRGRSISLHHDEADLRGTYVGNDRISSLRVDCRGGYDRPAGYYGDSDDGRPAGYYDRGGRERGVTVYSDAGFRGRAESFVYDDPDLRDNPICQDTISSVAVGRGCRVVLYDDVGYRGAATELTGDHDNLGSTRVGNDRVSSIRVDCRRR